MDARRLTLAVVIGRYELERVDIAIVSRQQRFQPEFLHTQRSSRMSDGSDVLCSSKLTFVVPFRRHTPTVRSREALKMQSASIGYTHLTSSE